jgi:uncharacterized membrane protein required for colicin V production
MFILLMFAFVLFVLHGFKNPRETLVAWGLACWMAYLLINGYPWLR